MNKFLKLGLVLQIPNLTVILLFISYFIIKLIDWNQFNGYVLIWIFLGTLYILINIISLIVIIIGLSERRELYK